MVSAKSINTVMTVKQVQEILDQDRKSNTRDLYALLFCVPIGFDLDGSTSVLATRCSYCKILIDQRVGICEHCDVVEPPQLSSTFDLRITLSDHTASLSGVHLSGTTAEKVLGVTADDFEKMSIDQRTMLKWNFLLERCAVRVVMVLSGNERPVVSIIDVERVDPREAAARYPAN